VIIQATPFLNVPDLKEALDRMTRILGFEVKFQVSGYAYLECGNAAIRVVEEPGRRPPPPGSARTAIYVDVTDVDAVYAELVPRLRTLPDEDVHPPRNQPWNQREFSVRLPDGNWIAYGQPREERAAPPDDRARARAAARGDADTDKADGANRPDDSDPDEGLED
jgi:catechol 2,3-dioxygenase-like lactoylglutathione lyase family enzyme